MQKFVQGSLVIIALLLGCVVAGLFSRSALSQAPTIATAAAATPGRYQLTATASGIQWILDTQTGRAWRWDIEPDHAQWKEDSPDYSKPAPGGAGK